MESKVVSIRMSLSNNTVSGRIERDYIEHSELNKQLEDGWRIAQAIESSSGKSDYCCITFILERGAPKGS